VAAFAVHIFGSEFSSDSPSSRLILRLRSVDLKRCKSADGSLNTFQGKGLTMESLKNHRRAMLCALALGVLVSLPSLASADWLKMDPPADVDKDGVTSPDNTCWMATAANMLAAAGYGNGVTLQARADDIYADLVTWQTSAANPTGKAFGGWADTAVTWWLGSANNTWAANPYNVVTVYGNKTKVPWANANGARFIGNELRDCQSMGLSISWPRTTASGSPYGGHAITGWGDNGTAANLVANPARVIVTDSDRETGGNVQTYTYDLYAAPNPGKHNEGNGWYINFNNNHPFIKHIVTLCPSDSAVDPADGPTQKVVATYTIHQNNLEPATDLHFKAWTDVEVLKYKVSINWNTANSPVIAESVTYAGHNRDTITVDWDLSDNPVPYCTWITITVEFIEPSWNSIWIDDVYFTYPGLVTTKFLQAPDETPNGMDIRIDRNDGEPRLLADDFECTTTGALRDVHLWNSWKDDQKGHVNKFHLFIYSDDPIGAGGTDPCNTFSKPDRELWSGEYSHYDESLYLDLRNEYEWWWDPNTGELVEDGDQKIWYYEIGIPAAEAFEQQGSAVNPITYWLGVWAETDGQGQIGWKTSKDHWNDEAAWLEDPNVWIPLHYPASHPYTLSLASGFEDLIAGTVYYVGANFATGDVQITTEPFQYSGGGWTTTGHAEVRTAGQAGGSGNEMETDNINLAFSFATPATAGLSLLFGEYGGNINMRINGSLQNFENFQDINGLTIGGVLVSVVNGGGNDMGVLTLAGSITDFMLGGQELHIDDVKYRRRRLDMAFGVTTRGPDGAGPDYPGFGWRVETQDVTDPCVPNITGGYVVGAFDLWRVPSVGDPCFVAESRFLHEYDFQQDPEVHLFSLGGVGDNPNIEARNFRFGHSYGRLGDEELAEFHEWMTRSPEQVPLSGGTSQYLPVNWEGRLPYPEGEVVPLNASSSPPECTVYLLADTNRDCFVNLVEVAITASAWMDTTVPSPPSP